MPNQSRKPLPKSRAILEVMYRHCCICIERANIAIHRGAQQIRILFEWEEGKVNWDEVVKRLRSINESHQRERDIKMSDASGLWPYCEEELIAAAEENFEKGGLARINGAKMVTDEKTARQFARSSVLFLLGQRIHITALQDLRNRVFEALEQQSADTRADTESLLASAAPRNEDVALLYLKILREKGPGKSEMQIALEFTDGNRARADTLLRGVRRYKKRLSGQ